MERAAMPVAARERPQTSSAAATRRIKISGLVSAVFNAAVWRSICCSASARRAACAWTENAWIVSISLVGLAQRIDIDDAALGLTLDLDPWVFIISTPASICCRIGDVCCNASASCCRVRPSRSTIFCFQAARSASPRLEALDQGRVAALDDADLRIC